MNARTSLATDIPPMMLATQGNCGECHLCGFTDHRVLGDVEDGDRVGIHEDCTPGGCNTHGSCLWAIETDRRAAELYVAITSAGPNELPNVIAELGPKAFLNIDRKAVQIFGCDDSVVLSIPLSTRQTAMLVD